MKKILDFLGPEYEDMSPVPKKYFPKVTALYCVLCIVLFGLINTAHNPYAWANLEHWGGASAYDVWNGHWWGLLTNNFMHVDLWHIILNLSWLVPCGKKIEYEEGPWFFLLLTITAGIFASCGQLAVDGSMGIGFSGVAYAMFGYIFVKDRYDERYRGFMRRSDKLSAIVWLFLCIIFTATDILPVGNGAHFGGILWGILLAYVIQPQHRWKIALMVPLFVACLLPAFWAPWQIPWLANKAGKLHDSQQLDAALKVYDEILKKDHTNDFAKNNKRNIKVYYLSKELTATMMEKDYTKSLVILDSMIALDPADTSSIQTKASIENYLRSRQ